MNNQTAIRVLEQHHIPYRFDGRQLQVLDRWTVDGVGYERWMICPSNMKRMKEWLGY